MQETRTLLDDVHVDEVSDDITTESENWITLSATMPYYGSDSLICLVPFLKKQLSRCKFIDEFKEPEITSSILNKKLTISFTTEHMTLSDLCDLIHLIKIPNINFTNEANQIIICYYKDSSTHPIHDIIIGVQSLNTFIPFFKYFFPDATENEIYSTFIRSYARIHDADIITDRNKTYVLYATQKAIAADKNGNFITDTWFHDIRCFREGFATVQRTDLRWNFINTHGKLLSPDKWFLRVTDFENGLAIVTDDTTGNDNFIKPDGSFLLDKWQNFLSPFSEGYACVVNENNLQNFIDMHGNVLFKKWSNYEYEPFVNGFSIISNKSSAQKNLIDMTGKLISETWFYKCSNFTKEGFAAVATDKFSYNFIDRNGNFLSKTSFDACRDFCEGYAAVNDAGRWNFIDTKGKKIFKTFEFINCKDFSEGFAIVETLKHTYLFINSKEKFLSLTRHPIHGFAMCEPFKNGIAKVYDKDKQFNFINKKGKLIFKNWINRYEQVIVAEDMFMFKRSGLCVDFKGNMLSTI